MIDLPLSHFRGGSGRHSWLVAQSCLTLSQPHGPLPLALAPLSMPGSSVHGTFQARMLEWVAISFSRGSSPPRDRTRISCITGRFFTTEPPGKPKLGAGWGCEGLESTLFCQVSSGQSLEDRAPGRLSSGRVNIICPAYGILSLLVGKVW